MGNVGLVTVDDVEISDEDLTALALAADPDTMVPDNATAITDPDHEALGLLPDWYMPSGTPRTRRGWRRIVAIVVVMAFVAINAYGLCSTYGVVEFG